MFYTNIRVTTNAEVLCLELGSEEWINTRKYWEKNLTLRERSPNIMMPQSKIWVYNPTVTLSIRVDHVPAILEIYRVHEGYSPWVSTLSYPTYSTRANVMCIGPRPQILNSNPVSYARRQLRQRTSWAGDNSQCGANSTAAASDCTFSWVPHAQRVAAPYSSGADLCTCSW